MLINLSSPAVRIAASFNKIAKSAPVKPGVLLAILSSKVFKFLFLACTSRIDNLQVCGINSYLPIKSTISIVESKISGLL